MQYEGEEEKKKEAAKEEKEGEEERKIERMTTRGKDIVQENFCNYLNFSWGRKNSSSFTLLGYWLQYPCNKKIGQ